MHIDLSSIDWLLYLLLANCMASIVYKSQEEKSFKLLFIYFVLSLTILPISVWLTKYAWNHTGVLPYIHFNQMMSIQYLIICLLGFIKVKQVQ